MTFIGESLIEKYFPSRYLVQNFDWLEEKLGDVDDDYILFDCPGVLGNSTVILISIPLSSE